MVLFLQMALSKQIVTVNRLQKTVNKLVLNVENTKCMASDSKSCTNVTLDDTNI